MAPSAGKPSVALHIALIFFVMATVILGVSTFIIKRERDQKVVDLASVQSEASSQKTALTKLQAEVADLKKVLGKEFTDIGAVGDNNANTVIGGIVDDMTKFAGDVAQPTTSATLAKMRETIDNLMAERDGLQQQLNERDKTLAALNQQYGTRTEQHSKAQDDAEKDLADVQASVQKQLAAKDSQVSELRRANTELETALAAEKEAHANTQRELGQTITNLTAINKDFQDKLSKIEKTSFEQPSGKITFVNHQEGIVWINLGEDDNLPIRTTFSIYDVDHEGVARDEQDVKGKIEVTLIKGPHLAEARILDDDIYRTIIPGDPIYTPLWSAGRKQNFSLVGLIDVDGDKVSDRELLKEKIRAAGGDIDNEVDDKGNRTGKGISVHTKFLIVGEIPDPEEAADPEEKKAALEISNVHSIMVEEARQQGVRVLDLNSFLNFMGFKNTKRVWRPGQETPWALKQGGLSSEVGGRVSDRVSSGQVSERYSTSRLKKQKVSTGQTSDVLGKRRRGTYGN